MTIGPERKGGEGLDPSAGPRIRARIRRDAQHEVIA